MLPSDWLDKSLLELASLTPIQWLDWPPLAELGIYLGLRRDDLVDPILGGNKFYKLHGHLNNARRAGIKHIVSFGGAYSNHIYALAAAGRELGMQTTGIIRGEEPSVLSPTLSDAREFGMQLMFVSRTDYKKRNSLDYMKALEQQLGPCYWVPEGAGDLCGAQSCAAIGTVIAAIDEPIDVVCVPCGTGSTFAGLIASLPSSMRAVGFSVLKGSPQEGDDLQQRIAAMLERLGGHRTAWSLHTDYACGGYAKYPPYLSEFMINFEQQTGVLLDPVYTAKMMWGIWQMALNGEWNEGERILALHTGGLQGRRGFHLYESEYHQSL